MLAGIRRLVVQIKVIKKGDVIPLFGLDARPYAPYSSCPSGVALLLSSGEVTQERLRHRNVQRFQGGHVFKAHRLCLSLNSRRESNKEEEDSSCPSGVALLVSSGEVTSLFFCITLMPRVE